MSRIYIGLGHCEFARSCRSLEHVVFPIAIDVLPILYPRYCRSAGRMRERGRDSRSV